METIGHTKDCSFCLPAPEGFPHYQLCDCGYDSWCYKNDIDPAKKVIWIKED